MESQLCVALNFALIAHDLQIDKAGQPYILHPLRVMNNVETEEEKIVAILHDVIEDSEITINDIEWLDFSKEIIDALKAITKRKNEKYDDYIERVSKNKIATIVKIEDLKDNIDVTRLQKITDNDIKRVIKYHTSLFILKGKLQLFKI